ncbi:PHF5-like protein [Ostertagia ostertagi]
MAKHHPDLIFCRKQPGVAIGRLCEKCDGRCVICDSYVRPCSLVRICDECNYGSYQGRCVICGGPGVSEAYYCKECTIMEKDRDGCPKIVNLGTSLLESAGCLFSYNNMSPGAVGKEVAKFTARMKTRDPRFASVFTRTIDALRDSPSVQNVDALMEVLVKCRMVSVMYGLHYSDHRDVANTIKHGCARSPFFQTGSSLSRRESYSRNSVGVSPSPCQRSDVASSNGPSRVMRVDPMPYGRPLTARMGTTASVPERILCIELCGALQGLEGTYFRKDSRGYLRVTDSCSISQAQRSVIESALSIAHLYIDVARVPVNRDDDLLAQAFLLESQSILEEYIHDVGDVPVNQMIAVCPQQGYRLIWVPPFFPKWIAEYVLKIGKSWRSVDLRSSSENLDKARAIVASQLDSKCLYLQTCRLVCGSVVRSLVVEHHLLDHFDAAHCLLLLHDAQFSLSLYRQFCECTHGLRSKLSKRDANNALVAAAASSTTAKRFPFQLNLESLCPVNDTPNTSSRLQFVQPLRPVYRPRGPVGEIFRNTEKKYESLFYFVWPLEMSLLTISEQANAVRQSTARMSRRSANETVKSLRLTSALLSCCERVLLRIRIYIAEVVDQFFKRLRLWIDEAIDLDAVDIHGLIMSILQISHELSQHCLDIIAEMESVPQRTLINGKDDNPTNAKTTQLLVTQAKLQVGPFDYRVSY